MIYDHTHGPHRFIVEDKDTEPTVARVLDSGSNLFAVEQYLDKGYDVQVAACRGPWPAKAGRDMGAGDVTPLLEIIYPYLVDREEEYGGWRELTEQDMILFRMKDIFSCLYVEDAADWAEETLDRLKELYYCHPVYKFLEPYVASDLWAAVFVAGLGDPRSYVDRDDPSDTKRLFSFLGLTDESCIDPKQHHTRKRLRLSALAAMTFGNLGPISPNAGILEMPMGKAFLRHIEESGAAATLELKSFSFHLVDGGTINEAALIALRMMAHYVFSVWWNMEYVGEFHPQDVFDEEGSEKFFSIFGRSSE